MLPELEEVALNMGIKREDLKKFSNYIEPYVKV